MNTKQHIIGTLVMIALLLIAALPAAAQAAALVELVGTIEAVAADSIVVNGQSVDISAAEMQVAAEVGLLVEVEGLLQTDGSIVAREVKAVTDGTLPGEFELIGILDAIDGDSIEIAGQLIDVTNAEIKPGVSVGELVKVHASMTIAGWVAREVEPTTAEDEDSADSKPEGEFEITGTLQEFSDDSIVLSGQTISIVGAELKNALVVGVLVKAHVSVVDGVLVAREVENAFNEDDSSDDESSDDDSSSDDSSDDYSDVVIDDAATNAQEAIAIVQGIYPNTRILEIELSDLMGAGLVWEIKTSHGLEIKIDVATGAILVIDDSSDDSNDDNGDDSDDDNGDDSNDDNGDDSDDDNGDDSNDDNDDDSNDDSSDDDSSDDDSSDDDSGDDDSGDDD
jgi:hypothetical protein